MKRVVRIASVAQHSRHGRDDCAAMLPDERVAHLLRMCEQMFGNQTTGLLRVARVHRLRKLPRRAATRAHA